MLFADEDGNATVGTTVSIVTSRFHNWPFSWTTNLNIGITLHNTSLVSVAERLFSTSITGLPWLELASFGL